MKTICDLCKKLYNPIRLELLKRAYTALDGGVNVGFAQDDSGLGISGTSQYLKQLEDLGLIRRERAGRYVNYLADWSHAPSDIGEIAALLSARFKANGEVESLVPFFGVMMNPLRARVVHYLAKGGDGTKTHLIERFKQSKRTFDRDLKPARDAGLLDMDDDDATAGRYIYLAPSDPIALRIIELIR